MFRSVFVYIIPAALNKRFPELSKFVVLPNFFQKRFLPQTYSGTTAVAVLLTQKYCLRFVYGQKFCYQLRIRPLNVLPKIKDRK